MHDIKYIRENYEKFNSLLSKKGVDFSAEINSLIELDEKRRVCIQKVEALKAKRNATSKMIGQYKRQKTGRG